MNNGQLIKLFMHFTPYFELGHSMEGISKMWLDPSLYLSISLSYVNLCTLFTCFPFTMKERGNVRVWKHVYSLYLSRHRISNHRISNYVCDKKLGMQWWIREILEFQFSCWKTFEYFDLKADAKNLKWFLKAVHLVL